MTVQEIEPNIESQGSSYFTISPVLDGQTYEFTFTWRVRSTDNIGAWYLDIGTAVHGIKLVNGIDLLGPYHYIDALPPGKLGVYRNKGRLSKPGFFNFGVEKEMTMVYEEA